MDSWRKRWPNDLLHRKFPLAVARELFTAGITELFLARAHIDLGFCFLDVVSSYPPVAASGKGETVRLVKET